MKKSALILAMAAGVLVIFNVPETEARMTLAQIKNAMKGVAKTCITKSGVSPEILQQTKNGEFPPDRNLQCYYLCLLSQMKVIKDGSVALDVINKQVDMMMPTDIIARCKEVSQICHDKVTSDDACERSWEFTKCFYETDSSDNDIESRKFEIGRCKRRRGVPRCTGHVGSRRRQDYLSEGSLFGLTDEQERKGKEPQEYPIREHILEPGAVLIID